jgi:hypothetical protein
MKVTFVNFAATLLAPIAGLALLRYAIGRLINGPRDEYAGACLAVAGVCIVTLFLLGVR